MTAKPHTSTLVVQSFRAIPEYHWIRRCLDSVSDWAERSGYSYEFLDDAFLSFAPDWVRKHCTNEILPVTDIARLYLIKKRLQQYRRVIWVDADVLIFAPEHIQPDRTKGYALTREVWLYRRPGSAISVKEKVNNSYIVMERNHPMLDFLIFASEETIRNLLPNNVGRLAVGTDLITRLSKVMPIRVLSGAATFSPVVIEDLSNGTHAVLYHLRQRHNTPLGSANLCASLTGRHLGTVTIHDSDILRTIDVLVSSRGEVINGNDRIDSNSQHNGRLPL